MRETLHIRLPDWNQPETESAHQGADALRVAYALTST